MKGEFVGKSKFHGDAEAFVDDHDYNNEDVDNDDGQVPVDVVADNILPGLCFLF